MPCPKQQTPPHPISSGRKLAPSPSSTRMGAKHKLSDYKGKNVVLFFYPKDDTAEFVFTHEENENDKK